MLLRYPIALALVPLVSLLASEEAKDGIPQDAERTVDGEMLVKWENIYFFDTESEPFTGRAYSTFEDGTPRYDAHIIDGKPHGLVTIYHENGNKMFCARYNHGVQQGREENWHKNGKLQFAIHYEKGGRHGKMTSFHDDGRRQMDIFFDHGKIHGPFIVYDKEGNISSYRIYFQGKLALTRKSSDYELEQDQNPSQLFSGILEKQQYEPFQSNNPGYPQRVDVDGKSELELTNGKNKKSTAHIGLTPPVNPPFELSLEYLAIPTKSNALNFGSSAMAVLFGCKDVPKFGPGIEEDPGMIPGTGGYTLQLVTNSRWKGISLFDPDGKRVSRSNASPSSGKDWRHLRIIADLDNIVVKLDGSQVIEFPSPAYPSDPRHLAITAANGKVASQHVIRSLHIQTKPTPGSEHASQWLNSHPEYNEHRIDTRTVGVAHILQKENHKFYEFGEDTPFTGKAIDYYQTGVLKIEGYYKNGNRHGKHSIWYPDGTIATQTVYADGETCLERKWDAKGNILP